MLLANSEEVMKASFLHFNVENSFRTFLIE